MSNLSNILNYSEAQEVFTSTQIENLPLSDIFNISDAEVLVNGEELLMEETGGENISEAEDLVSMSTPGALGQLLEKSHPIVLQFLGSEGHNQFNTHDSLLSTWKTFVFDDTKLIELNDISKTGGIIKVTKRRVFRGMDLIIQDYEVLARESPLIIHVNGLTSLTPEWYVLKVRGIGMVDGSTYDKNHPKYDSDSPPRPPPRKKQRRAPNSSHSCERCDKRFKTAAALKGHITKVHANRLID